MTSALSLHLLALLLALPSPQEAAPPAPSVADAARAARERQKTAASKHVLTDDEIAPGRGAADATAAAGNESQVRAQMQKSFPASPTVADLRAQIEQIGIYSRYQPADLTAKFKTAALYGYEKVEFPGKKEWEEQLETAVTHYLDEAARAVPRLQAVLDENQDALLRRDPAASQKVRSQWIDAVVAYASWQLRLQQLIEDGQARPKAFLNDSAAALSEYRQGRSKQAESTIGWILITLHDQELKFKQIHNRFTCDLTDFNFNATNPNKPLNYQTGWENKMETVRNLGYRILVHGCNAEGYTALAIPPLPDGSQGRAFCTGESGAIRRSADGSTANCQSGGSDWHGE